MTARDRLILALDLPSWETAEGIVKRLEGKIHLFKVGLELFTAEATKPCASRLPSLSFVCPSN